MCYTISYQSDVYTKTVSLYIYIYRKETLLIYIYTVRLFTHCVARDELDADAHAKLYIHILTSISSARSVPNCYVHEAILLIR